MDRELGALEGAEALRWWIRSGVTDALDEKPHDRFADSVARGEDERGAMPPEPASRPSPPAPAAQPLRRDEI
ncbi:MAG TPA: hypothetical protein VLI91_09840, partial [Roseiarcus sp.]|nr:hypothetical protein [Roseiarcus sp.]